MMYISHPIYCCLHTDRMVIGTGWIKAKWFLRIQNSELVWALAGQLLFWSSLCLYCSKCLFQKVLLQEQQNVGVYFHVLCSGEVDGNIFLPSLLVPAQEIKPVYLNHWLFLSSLCGQQQSSILNSNYVEAESYFLEFIMVIFKTVMY